ncbi:MAG TPA: hypothetical protein VGI82_02380 [Chitinophagaceae bacterium]|jgi:hypothetical protein
MKGIFTERNFVIVLFVLVIITFSFAQNETKKMEQLYNGGHTSLEKFPALRPEAKAPNLLNHPLRAIKVS